MMKMFRFSRLRLPVRPALAPNAVSSVMAKPLRRDNSAPKPPSVDSDGRLRRIRQLVEDNRLL
jgi:hypothetical protein